MTSKQPSLKIAPVMAIQLAMLLAAGLALALWTHGSDLQDLPAALPAHESGGMMSVEQVDVLPGRLITVWGRSTLPQGTWIETQLLADGEPVPWWPTSFWVAVREDGRWGISVYLGKQTAADELDPSSSYALRAWPEADPGLEAVFWFRPTESPSP